MNPMWTHRPVGRNGAESHGTPETATLGVRRFWWGVAVVLTVGTGVLLWSKWGPYAGQIVELSGTGRWSEHEDLLRVGGVQPGDPPSWTAAVSFTSAYFAEVARALVAALVLSAAVQACLPRELTARWLGARTGLGGALLGGGLATPTMMCTCCAAPVAVTLRRHGASSATVVAYWLGNPLLNPAVLTFLLLVAPWQWTLVRSAIGMLLVVAGAALVERLAAAKPVATGPIDTFSPGQWPVRFVTALARMSLILVPEYLVVVALLGALRGWLLDGTQISAGILAVVAAAVVGTLLAIPTAAEIPILQALVLAGASDGVVGALLVTLPAVSLPGMVMLRAGIGMRAAAATAATVAFGGVAAGGFLGVL